MAVNASSPSGCGGSVWCRRYQAQRAVSKQQPDDVIYWLTLGFQKNASHHPDITGNLSHLLNHQRAKQASEAGQPNASTMPICQEYFSESSFWECVTMYMKVFAQQLWADRCLIYSSWILSVSEVLCVFASYFCFNKM